MHAPVSGLFDLTTQPSQEGEGGLSRTYEASIFLYFGMVFSPSLTTYISPSRRMVKAMRCYPPEANSSVLPPRRLLRASFFLQELLSKLYVNELRW